MDVELVLLMLDVTPPGQDCNRMTEDPGIHVGDLRPRQLLQISDQLFGILIEATVNDDESALGGGNDLATHLVAIHAVQHVHSIFHGDSLFLN